MSISTPIPNTNFHGQLLAYGNYLSWNFYIIKLRKTMTFYILDCNSSPCIDSNGKKCSLIMLIEATTGYPLFYKSWTPQLIIKPHSTCFTVLLHSLLAKSGFIVVITCTFFFVWSFSRFKFKNGRQERQVRY